MKPHNAKYPTREWLGKYEKWVLIMHGRWAFREVDYTLEQFFGMFPKKNSVDDFTSIDIADWKAWHLKNGSSDGYINNRLAVLRRFWIWLNEDCGLAIANPVRAYKRSIPRTRQALKINISLEEVDKLLDECPDEQKRIVLSVMSGGRCPRGRARNVIREAALRVGLKGFSLSKLKFTFRNRLARDVIKKYCDQVLNSLPSESKLDSNSLRAIQGPPSNERPPVGYSNDNLPPGDRVNQE